MWPNSCHDRADNWASTYGKLHITALGNERYRIFDERSQYAYLYECHSSGTIKLPVPLEPRETAILEVIRRRAELKQDLKKG